MAITRSQKTPIRKIGNCRTPLAPLRKGRGIPRSPLVGRTLFGAYNTPLPERSTLLEPPALLRVRGPVTPRRVTPRNLTAAFAAAATPTLTRSELVREMAAIAAYDTARVLFHNGRGRSPRTRRDDAILTALYELVLRRDY